MMMRYQLQSDVVKLKASRTDSFIVKFQTLRASQSCVHTLMIVSLSRMALTKRLNY